MQLLHSDNVPCCLVPGAGTDMSWGGSLASHAWQNFHICLLSQQSKHLEVRSAGDDMRISHDMAVSVPDGAAACALGHLLHQVQRELVPPAPCTPDITRLAHMFDNEFRTQMPLPAATLPDRHSSWLQIEGQTWF